jgi:hypothetical protein
MVRQGRGRHEIWRSPLPERNFAVPVGIASRDTANAILRQAGLSKAFRPSILRREVYYKITLLILRRALVDKK